MNSHKDTKPKCDSITNVLVLSICSTCPSLPVWSCWIYPVKRGILSKFAYKAHYSSTSLKSIILTYCI